MTARSTSLVQKLTGVVDPWNAVGMQVVLHTRRLVRHGVSVAARRQAVPREDVQRRRLPRPRRPEEEDAAVLGRDLERLAHLPPRHPDPVRPRALPDRHDGEPEPDGALVLVVVGLEVDQARPRLLLLELGAEVELLGAEDLLLLPPVVVVEDADELEGPGLLLDLLVSLVLAVEGDGGGDRLGRGPLELADPALWRKLHGLSRRPQVSVVVLESDLHFIFWRKN